MLHYQEVRRANAERRLALGLSGDGTPEGTMNPFCGALDGDATPLVTRVDCPGCRALLLLRRMRWELEHGITIETDDASRQFAEAIELLVSLGDAP